MLKRRFGLVLLLVLVVAVSNHWAMSQQEEAPIPAYNAHPPAKGERLPPILKKEQLWGVNVRHNYQIHAYELASRIQPVLYQQPCYCYCDRMGHKSLHSCFEGLHGAECSTCMQELYYVYLQNKKGKTASQIRAGIIRGEWKQIDLGTAASIE
jgi:hypothetical protein